MNSFTIWFLIISILLYVAVEIATRVAKKKRGKRENGNSDNDNSGKQSGDNRTDTNDNWKIIKYWKPTTIHISDWISICNMVCI